MQFSNIVGQEEVKSRLRKLVLSGRVPHALLFTGKPGTGTLPAALALAQYMACTCRTETDSCCKCPACLQFGKMQHPDLHFVYPVLKKGSETPVADDYAAEWRNMVAENPYFTLDDWYARMGAEGKQGLIYEKESSEIVRKLSLKSYGNGYKTMIIWLPEKMNTVCANKLLKIIEEPPSETLFILVSEAPDELLATIRSRVQTILFPPLPDNEIALALTEQFPDMTADKALETAHIAEGSFSRALKVAGDNFQREEFFRWWTFLLRKAWLVGHKKDYDALLRLKQWSTDTNYVVDGETDENGKPLTQRTAVAAGREIQKAFLEYTLAQVRENFIANIHLPVLNYQTADEQQFSARFAPFIHSGNVEPLTEQLELARAQIEQNANQKMVFFDLCLQLIVLIKKQ